MRVRVLPHYSQVTLFLIVLFFFKEPAPPEISPLPLHAALPISAGQYRHAVVIGGGLLGLEAANGLMKQGMKVTVVHLPDLLMERQLDAPAARMLKKSLEDRGLQFILGGVTEEIIGKARGAGG